MNWENLHTKSDDDQICLKRQGDNNRRGNVMDIELAGIIVIGA